MSIGPRRGVTRGYVGGLIVAAVIVAAALLIVVWGGLSLWLPREPVVSAVPRWGAPLLLLADLAALAWSLWLQALALLQGRCGPAWGHIVVCALGAYLLWCLGGVLLGLSIEETWVSPFAAVLVPIWGCCALLFWAVLARRVYTDRPAPRWPWEREGE